MKVFALSVLCLGCVLAQTAAPQAPPKAAALPDLAADTKIAAFDDGTVMTMGELRGILSNLDAQQRQGAVANIQGFLDEWALLHKVAQLALTDKLDQESPIKEQLLYARTLVLYQAEVQHQGNPTKIEGDEVDQYYAGHKEKYQQVKTDAIYIAFSNSAASQTGSDGKKILSEAEAKAKIAGLLEQIRKGGDFKKLAKENSDDETSRAKDGYFATLSPTDNIPDAIRTAVFALKTGETTDVIGQPNGFYLFRAEEITFKPLSEVRDQIYQTLKTERLEKWMAKMHNETKAKILNPALIGGK
ncbi:MAG: peptidylprolyl isomerase [Bryobacteraceae bacterium]|jgi:peptidyl-prolyl cis-trans isomerase C